MDGVHPQHNTQASYGWIKRGEQKEIKSTMKDVFECLRQRLDAMSVGFPGTDNQVEIRLLKWLFLEEEAKLFLELSPTLETPQAVADRLSLNVKDISEKMEEMAQKGLLFRHRKGDLVRYAIPPFVVGIYEFQVMRMDSKFAKEFDEYFETTFGPSMESFQTPVLRTIPINRKLVAAYSVAPYDDVLGVIDDQNKIAVAPCVCRTVAHLNEKSCEKPTENCFLFGSHAEYYVENGLGRFISKEEAKEIIRENEEQGLVMQPFNSQKAGGMCSCCGDCCGILRSLKMQPKPVQSICSNYFAQVESELCTGCETCVERCQMEAIDAYDGISKINLDRCIGCGLCVSTCPVEAIALIQKSKEQLYEPPQSGVETYIRIARERGKL
jgi:Pyruvate/2-oxoacid:ferredoxin oxidoreductase delta subunit